MVMPSALTSQTKCVLPTLPVQAGESAWLFRDALTEPLAAESRSNETDVTSVSSLEAYWMFVTSKPVMLPGPELPSPAVPAPAEKVFDAVNAYAEVPRMAARKSVATRPLLFRCRFM